MRILYVSGSYVPSRRASSVHVMKMCAALARLGHQVTLVSKLCASRQEAGITDDFAFYGVEPRFELRKLPRPAGRGGGLRYLREVVRLVSRDGAPGFDLHYCREPLAAWQLARAGRPVLLESHVPPGGWWSSKLHGNLARRPALRRSVVISRALADRFETLGLLPRYGDLLVAHDAADSLDSGPPPAIEGRGARLGYAGHLYPGKGAELLFRLAPRLPRHELHVFGGSAPDLAAWRRRPRPANLQLRGFVAPGRLPARLSEMDILLLPYQERVLGASAGADLSRWMSPLKLFEYMAAGRPIVASDLPVLREILRHERNCLLVSPADADGWARAIERLVADAALRRRLGEAAQQEQRRDYTWDARARAVLRSLPGERG